MTQTWLHQRFTGLAARDFEDGVHFHCIPSLHPPPGLDKLWSTEAGSLPDVKAKRAIFVLASPADPQQVSSLEELVQTIDSLGTQAPPVFWVPHTVPPEAKGRQMSAAPIDLVGNLLEMGLDGLVCGEPKGFSLALALRMQLHKVEIATKTMNTVMLERRRKAQNLDYIKEQTDCLLWDYLRNRLAPTIPPCDYSLPRGVPPQIEGYTIGSRRRTANGFVYRLSRTSADNSPVANGHSSVVSSPGGKESAKMVDKSWIKGMPGIMALKRMIDIMWTVSCEKWQHPNIARLLQVYHSPSQIILRMEYSGSCSLFARLARRARIGKDQRPLSFHKTSQIIQQTLRALVHLHLGPKVCHRDIKPENFDLHEAVDSATIKLTGFELAILQEDANGFCRSACGSIPFAAPETMLQPAYNAMPADIWSLGVTIFEILCGPRALEKALSLLPEDSKASQANSYNFYRRPDKGVAIKLREGLQKKGSASRLLQSHCLRELEPLLPSLRPMIDGMIDAYPEERWAAAQLLAVRFDEDLAGKPVEQPPTETADL